MKILLACLLVIVCTCAYAADVCLQGKVVTAVFPDCFYIEEPDRSSAIAVVLDKATQVTVKEGYLVTLYGACQTWQSGERYFLANKAIFQGTQTLEQVAIGMTNKAVGGSRSMFLAGPAGGTGINNVGSLVTVWGQVERAGSGYFTISDGSLPVGLDVEAEGMRVLEVGTFVLVTGISSLEASLRGPTRVVRVRRQEDIVTK